MLTPAIGLSPTEIRDIYAVRRPLLTLLATLVVKHASAADLESLSPLLGDALRCAAERDTDAYFAHRGVLHDRLVELAENQTLARVLADLTERTRAHRRASLNHPGGLAASADHDMRVVEALQNRDGELAGALLTRAASASLGTLTTPHQP